MNEIRYRDGAIELTERSLDFFIFNSKIKQRDISYFKVKSKGQIVEVDVDNATIKVNGKVIINDSKLNLLNLRWINFRRNFVHYVMGSGDEPLKEHIYGIGFQGKLGEKNYKRIVLVSRSGYSLE